MSLFKGAGNAATWYIPAAIGLYEKTNAPEGQKMREFFGQGFSVLGGFFGTILGSWAASSIAIPAATQLAAFYGLCLRPFGVFVIIVVCTGIAGYVAMNWSKDRGYQIYDSGNQLRNGQIYQSTDQLLGQLRRFPK